MAVASALTAHSLVDAMNLAFTDRDGSNLIYTGPQASVVLLVGERAVPFVTPLLYALYGNYIVLEVVGSFRCKWAVECIIREPKDGMIIHHVLVLNDGC